ncbi:MAG: DUF4340 domain-containing protein [Verrucomicrobia bacterium]|nr:DUF4340 domain-containing protein [Verrucomicrobiota bacterium]
MNSRITWWLLALTTGVFAYIMGVERRLTPSGRAQPQLVLRGFNARAIAAVEIIRSNFTIRAERHEEDWQLTAPIQYPAQAGLIESLLARLGQLQQEPLFTEAELRAHPTAAADFGTEPARAALVLHEKDGSQIRLNFGELTPPGDQVYFQSAGSPVMLLTEATLLDQLPTSPDAWRNPSLLPLRGLRFDRVEVRSGNFSYALQRDATNQLWQLVKPQPAAPADQTKVGMLLQQLAAAQFARFVTNSLKPDLDLYGLLPPKLELIFGADTNDLINLQIGKNPTNEPALAFARLPGTTNFALVPEALFELLHVPPTDWRDRRLLAADLRPVDLVEARGKENFALRRLPDGGWQISGTNDAAADTALVQEFLAVNLPQLEITRFVKDVVTDFAPFGLAKPVQQYIFKTTLTNAAGVTNQIVAQIDFGASLIDTLYARRGGEDAVYEAGLADFLKLPKAAWELRDRQIWNFPPSAIASVTIKQLRRERKLLRSARGEWSLAPVYQGNVNAFSPETTAQGLARLRAETWIARGDTLPLSLRFTETDFSVSVEVLTNGQSQQFTIEFGRRTLRQGVYAAALVDGRRMIFEVSQPLFEEVLRDFSIPTPGAGR